MTTDRENSKHIIADEGKVFQRISDGFVFGNEIYLGYAYMIGDVTLDVPILELPEHFIEIDMPIDISTEPLVP